MMKESIKDIKIKLEEAGIEELESIMTDYVDDDRSGVINLLKKSMP